MRHKRPGGFLCFRPLSRERFLAPLVFLEADEDKAFSDENRALDQHAVGGQEAELFLLRHSGQLFL